MRTTRQWTEPTERDAICEAAIVTLRAFGDHIVRDEPDTAARVYQLMVEVQKMRRPEVIEALEAQRMARAGAR